MPRRSSRARLSYGTFISVLSERKLADFAYSIGSRLLRRSLPEKPYTSKWSIHAWLLSMLLVMLPLLAQLPHLESLAIGTSVPPHGKLYHSYPLDPQYSNPSSPAKRSSPIANLLLHSQQPFDLLFWPLCAYFLLCSSCLSSSCLGL